MKKQHFFTYKECKTSINITTFHYVYLIYLSETRFNGNLTLTIDYLLRKYLAYLYKISLAPTKRTLTATYQPRTKKLYYTKNQYTADILVKTLRTQVSSRIFDEFYHSYHVRLGDARCTNFY